MSKWNELFSKMNEAVKDHDRLTDLAVSLIWEENIDEETLAKVNKQLDIVQEKIDFYYKKLNELK